MVSPTARTLAECKKRGWIAQVVEQTIPRTFIKRDLFGIIDVIAVTPGRVNIGGLCCVYKQPFDAKPGEHTCDSCGTTNALVPGEIIGIQATSGTNHAARREKALSEPRLRAWIDAGGRFEIWSFSKTGVRGKRKKWTLRTEEVKP